MQKIISTIKECMTGKTCCEETGVNCRQGRACPVREGTHKPAEAVHQIQEPPTVLAAPAAVEVPDEREAFEAFRMSLITAPNAPVNNIFARDESGEYLDKFTASSWKFWQGSRAALAATPAEKSTELEVMEDMLSSARMELDMVREALGVAIEPHQSLFERMLEAAEAKAAAPVVLPEPVSDEQIKAVFLANGFTIKEGLTDLKPYVYQAARALLATGGQAQADARDAELLDFLEANAASLTLEDGLWEIVVRGKTMNWATDGKTAREAIAAAKVG